MPRPTDWQASLSNTFTRRVRSRRFDFSIERTTLGHVRSAHEAPVDGPLEVVRAREDALAHEDVAAFVHAMLGNTTDAAGLEGDVAVGRALTSVGVWMRLASFPADLPLPQRIPALRIALAAAALAVDFQRGQELPAYIKAAQKLADSGASVVVFGRTHLAKHIPLSHGALYINVGTWADLIRFPETVLVEPAACKTDPLLAFVYDMNQARFSEHLHFSPAYARIELEDDSLKSASLEQFNTEEP